MYFLDLKSLVNHLKAEKNTERESFQYAVGLFLFGLFGVEGVFSSDGISTIVGAVSFVAFRFVFAVVGYLLYKHFYKCNGGDGGKCFLHRILALYFVITLRISVVFLPALFFGWLLMTFVPSVTKSPLLIFSSIAIVLIGCLYTLFYGFFAMSNSLTEISKGITPQSVDQAESEPSF